MGVMGMMRVMATTGIMGIARTMGMMGVMFVSTTTCRLMHQLHAKDIEQEQGEDACTSPFEPASHLVTASMGVVQMVGEPFTGQEIVDAKAEEDGTANDGCEVEHECLLTQDFVDDEVPQQWECYPWHRYTWAH